MPIQADCDCGKAYRVKDELAGKRFRCGECGDVVRIPQEEEEPMEVTLAEEPVRRRARPVEVEREERRSSRRSVNSRHEERDEEERPTRRRSLLRDEEPEEEPERPRKKKKKKRPSSSSSGSSGDGWLVGSLGPILGGLVMMIGGAVWLFVGLANDRFFIYSPVVIVVGLITFFKGITGQE